MNKRDAVANILTKFYKQDLPESGFVQLVSFVNESCSWTDEMLNDMRVKKFGKKKKFYITDIVPQTCKDLPHYATSLTYSNKGQRQIAKFADKSGVYKIVFSDGAIMHFAKWFSGGGRAAILESMFAAEKDTWDKYLRLFEEVRKKKSKPKPGAWRISQIDGIIMYEPIKKIPNNKIFHTELDKIRNSVNYYFSNVPSFMKYNQPGRRSLLLYGEQGTSKTSTLYQLALEHQKTKCVVFSTDINALAIHVRACERYKVPTLVFFEDAEGVFSQNNSSVKNFLSGIDAKQNKAGTCIVYTTNYPERIEATIIERPERIDELHYIGPIDGTMLVDCARFYFGKHLPKTVNLQRVLTKAMTGAEVKLMVENTLRFCASERLKLNEDAINKVLHNYLAEMRKLKKFTDAAKKTYAKNADMKKNMGFGAELDETFIELSPSNKTGHTGYTGKK